MKSILCVAQAIVSALIWISSLAGCGGGGGSGGGSPDTSANAASDGAGGGCPYIDPEKDANGFCLHRSCESGTWVSHPLPKGTICGGNPDASTEWAECDGCGVCTGANYGADPCTGVADKQPCRNGRGICYGGVCAIADAGCS